MTPEKMHVPALPQDQAVLAAIGKIALRHGHLELALKMAVRTFADLEVDEALDATARQGMRELMERVRRLARQRMGEGQALCRLDALLQRARQASEKRNEVVHSLWAHELDGDPVLRADGGEFKPIPTVSELETLALEIEQVTKDMNLARLIGFLHAALAKSN